MNTFATTEFKELLDLLPQSHASLPTNTIAHIFRHDYKENFISDWLAFLLNPEYTGSTEPLSALLQLANVTSPVDFYDVSILREAAFDDRKRIDFIIETSSHIIGIENKIQTGIRNDKQNDKRNDMPPNQLKDYELQLKKMAKTANKELVLIFLYPQWNKSCSILTNKELYGFSKVTYEDLVFKFKQIRLNIFENLRAYFLMEDFILHMEEYIMKESLNTEINLEMWYFENENRNKLNELNSALKKSKEQFNNYIKSKMEELILKRNDREEWKINIATTYIQLYKESWDTCQVHFELLKTEGDSFAPSELKVVLHTHERRIEPRTKTLWKMGKGSERNITIDYKSQEAFDRSMNNVFESLKNLIDEYTDKIDSEMNDPQKVPFTSLE